MEWVAIGLLAVLSWIQTERLDNAQDERDHWKAQAELNATAATEAAQANDTLTASIDDLENANSDCAKRLGEFADSVNSYEEAGRLQNTEIDRLRDELAEHNASPNLDVCVVPDWVTLGIE